jgi:hypothetical protein
VRQPLTAQPAVSRVAPRCASTPGTRRPPPNTHTHTHTLGAHPHAVVGMVWVCWLQEVELDVVGLRRQDARLKLSTCAAQGITEAYWRGVRGLRSNCEDCESTLTTAYGAELGSIHGSISHGHRSYYCAVSW